MEKRYLFREGQLIAKGGGNESFDKQSRKEDFLLVFHPAYNGAKEFWMSYRMVFFDPGYVWLSMPFGVTKELRTLLLLQS